MPFPLFSVARISHPAVEGKHLKRAQKKARLPSGRRTLIHLRDARKITIAGTSSCGPAFEYRVPAEGLPESWLGNQGI
jgi:hypothetical protein